MTLPRAQLKIHPAIAAAVITLCLALLLRLFWPIHLLLAEIAALVFLALAFRYWPPMITWFGRMALAHRVVFALIFLCILGGHFTFDNRTYFPFISWEIFSNAREVDPISCPEFLATTANGKRVRLLTEQLFPSIVQFYAPPADSVKMTELVHALARAYNRAHRDDPVQRVDLAEISVKLHPSGPPAALPSCQLLKRYDVSSDHLN